MGCTVGSGCGGDRVGIVGCLWATEVREILARIVFWVYINKDIRVGCLALTSSQLERSVCGDRPGELCFSCFRDYQRPAHTSHSIDGAAGARVVDSCPMCRQKYCII